MIKSCPHCGGQIFSGYPGDVACLQCGRDPRVRVAVGAGRIIDGVGNVVIQLKGVKNGCRKGGPDCFTCQLPQGECGG